METTDKKCYIEQTAFNMFLSLGYEATSIRMICKAAEIEPPTLYNFFGSKKGLFFSIAKKKLEQYINEAELHNDFLISLPLEMQLYSIFYTSINYTVEHVENVKYFYRYRLFCPEELREEVQEFLKTSYKSKINVIGRIFRECQKAKIIEIDADQATARFLRFLDNSSFNIVFENWKPSKEEVQNLWEAFLKCMLKSKK